MRATRTLLIASLVALLAPAGAGQAATRYFTDAQNNQRWSDFRNWEPACSGGGPTAVPTSADDAIICSGKTAQVSGSAVARTVTVQDSATLQIEPGVSSDSSLTLGSGSSALQSSADLGGIFLMEGTTYKATLAFVSADHVLVGYTGVIGNDDDAEITIASGKTLTCRTSKISGHLKIVGAGKFLSEGGLVQSNTQGGSAGVLLVEPYELADAIFNDQRPLWATYLTGLTGVTLKFGSGISVVNGGSPLTGRFVIADSLNTLIVDRELTTTGGLDIANGATIIVNQNLTMGGGSQQTASMKACSIQVAAGKTFTHY